MLESKMNDGRVTYEDTTTGIEYSTQVMGLEAIAKREAEESPLDELLQKVDLTSPLEIPLDSGKILNITKEDFISYYLPADATGPEKAKCFNETRAAGLNPAIKGDCHYFRTGSGPLSLFVGYHVYVRKAYANGLEHIGKPELVYDEETGQLDSCIITLEIEGRKEFVWETWYSEVEGQTKGQTNKRWAKAGRQMLIKCSVTNTLRMAGIATLGILPPMVDEMPDFPASGQRSLTDAQVEGHELPEAALGEVTATTHQVDMTPFRKKYFGMLKELGMTFKSDEERRSWQRQMFGVESFSGLDVEGYANVFATMADFKAELKSKEEPDPDPDPPQASVMDVKLTSYDGDGNVIPPIPRSESVKDDPDTSGTEEKDTPDDVFLLTDETHKEIKLALRAFPEQAYGTIGSKAFRDWAANLIGHRWKAIKSILEDEGKTIVAHLKAERGELDLAAKATGGVPKPEPEAKEGTRERDGEITEDFVDGIPGEPQDDPGGTEDNGSHIMEQYLLKANLRFKTRRDRSLWEKDKELPHDVPMGDWPESEWTRGYALLEGVPQIVYINPEQFEEIQMLIDGMPAKFAGANASLGSQEFRTFRFKILERKITAWEQVTESEAADIILQMKDAVQDENERIERQAEANKPTVI